MTLVPPEDEEGKAIQDIIDHNSEKGDWDISVPTYIPGISTSLVRRANQARALAEKGASVVPDVLKRD